MTGPPLASGVGAGIPARRNGRRRLLVPSRIVSRALLIAAVATVLFWPMYADMTPLLGLGVLLTVFVVLHSGPASYEAVWLPGLIAAGACIQWVIAPWFVYAVQSRIPVSRMAVDESQYFAFAIPATLAFIVGIYLPLWRGVPGRRGLVTSMGPAELRAFRTTCDMMIAGGVLTRVMLTPFAPVSLRFALYLVSILAFVGLMALCLAGARGWFWRAIVVFAVAALDNAASLQFLELLLWCACMGLVLCYRYRPSLRMTLAILGPGLLLFTAINAFKMLHRDEVRGMSLEAGERAAVTSSTVLGLIRDPATALGGPNLVATVSRLNEGFVTSRMLAWMPAAQPYARGETILTAVRAAVVPRLLDPGKYVAGGSEIVPRFTGIELLNSTSISLSIPGEMYANFGLVGSWIGTFVFGVILGMVYRVFVRRGAMESVWWAWAPFVLFGALSAEQSVGEVLNSLTKAAFVMWAVTRFLPAWRRLPRRARRAGATRTGSAPGGLELGARVA